MKFTRRAALVPLAAFILASALPTSAGHDASQAILHSLFVANADAAPIPSPASSPGNPAPSTNERLDGIAAVVNDDVILQSDVEEQLVLFVQNARIRPDSVMVDSLRKQILDQLINEKLIVAEAKRQGITANPAEVEREVDRAVKSTKERLGGDGPFREQLSREGLTEDKLRDKYRTDLERQMVAQRLQEKQVPRKPVLAAEAEAYFTANPDKFPKAPAQVRLSVIQIPVVSDSVTDAKAKASALAARKRIVAGEKFAKVAELLSDDDGTKHSGGDLGFFTRGSMEPEFEKAAFTLKLNTLSQPIRTPYGWHLVEVLERDTVRTRAGRDSLDRDGQPLLEAHARHLMIRVPLTQQDSDRALALANRVRDQALRGADFGTLVKRYSKYDAADENGDVGFVGVNTLQDNIRSGIDTLSVGEISQPLTNQVGYNLFKLTDRKPEHGYTLDEVRAELPQAVEEIKTRERMEEWVKSLRAKAHIEIRKA